ncbi:MAG: hypothetical protein RL638_801 [Bacteroidota bacterium]|jgi:hypothetical protein
MKRIILFSLLVCLGASCAKKAVAPFAPSAVTSQPLKPEVSEAEKQRVMNEVVPTNNVNQPAPNQVQQRSIEASLPAAAPVAPAAPKAQNESASLHVDRILDQKPVEKILLKKASLKKTKAAVSGPGNWAPQLKIGLTLLGIGVVLAVFGLGLVGGLAALIGLMFTIVGLLVTY